MSMKDDSQVDRQLETAKSIFREEYCLPKGITVDECVDSLKMPPLITSLRFNQMSTYSREMCAPEVQEEMIRKTLVQSNRNRLSCFSQDKLEVRAAVGIPDTWICLLSNTHSDAKSSATERKNYTDGQSVVIVDVLAGEACLRGADLFVPGIVACTTSLRNGHRVYVYCDVQGKCLRGRTSSFSDLELYHVGSGIAQVSRVDLFGTEPCSSGLGVSIDQPRYPLPSLRDFLILHPAFSAQNIPSCVAVQVLDPQSGETILDCCAAPGGKTLHIASLMRGTGKIVAIEKSAKRAKVLSATVRLYPCIEVHCADASKLSERRSLAIPYVYDRVLIDAPCSGSGNRPRLSLQSITVKQLKSCQKIQKSVVKSVVPLLKPGGCLVYSTCSVFASENEDLVAWMLKEFPELRLVKQSPYLGRPGYVRDGLSEKDASLLQRFDIVPSVSLDSIGFFIALLEKGF